MTAVLGIILALGLVLAVTAALANKGGNQAAKLEAMRAEMRRQKVERENANKIMDRVRNMPADDVRQRLQNLSGK